MGRYVIGTTLWLQLDSHFITVDLKDSSWLTLPVPRQWFLVCCVNGFQTRTEHIRNSKMENGVKAHQTIITHCGEICLFMWNVKVLRFLTWHMPHDADGVGICICKTHCVLYWRTNDVFQTRTYSIWHVKYVLLLLPLIILINLLIYLFIYLFIV